MFSTVQRDLSVSQSQQVRLTTSNHWPSTVPVVYIVAEEQGFGRSLQTAIEAYGVSVVWFQSAGEYLTYERGEITSCLLVASDASSFDCSCLRRMLSEKSSPPIVVLSNNADIPSCVWALKEGAHNYLTLPLVVPHLFQAIESAFDRDRTIRAQRKEIETLRSRWKSLTAREAEIMHYVAEGFLNKQTASQLNITENTVQVHRGRVMRKMHAESFAELVRMSLKLSD